MQVLVMILMILMTFFLQMKVDGKNLLGACKLAFKVCRNGINDYLIQNDTLLGMNFLIIYILDVETSTVFYLLPLSSTGEWSNS